MYLSRFIYFLQTSPKRHQNINTDYLHTKQQINQVHKLPDPVWASSPIWLPESLGITIGQPDKHNISSIVQVCVPPLLTDTGAYTAECTNIKDYQMRHGKKVGLQKAEWFRKRKKKSSVLSF